ncbi:MAG: type II toxin-antitoxin system VapC family toxin [Ardenticatenaceae bacterium]|nr:type II toxin-antitoxin system VapC family toxin [Ardenticatenaceae bacterium]MCB9446532.1 type II toxin-antitoxin system VapC family toxin [Ardenticatenaceae bacterium]
MTNRYVLDSYALLALLNDEPGAARVEDLLRQAEAGETDLSLSVINLGELAYIIERRWGPEKLRAILAYIEATKIQLATANQPRVLAAAHIKAQNPLSYADAFAAALTQELNATLLTGDPEFEAVSSQMTIEWLAKPV